MDLHGFRCILYKLTNVINNLEERRFTCFTKWIDLNLETRSKMAGDMRKIRVCHSLACQVHAVAGRISLQWPQRCFTLLSFRRILPSPHGRASKAFAHLFRLFLELTGFYVPALDGSTFSALALLTHIWKGKVGGILKLLQLVWFNSWFIPWCSKLRKKIHCQLWTYLEKTESHMAFLFFFMGESIIFARNFIHWFKPLCVLQ